MPIDYDVLALPKGPSRRLLKQRKDRSETAVKQKVRADVDERDGDCRLQDVPEYPCSGQSEWAHLETKRRARTRNRPPEERHTTEDSLKFCTGHHRRYDAHTLRIAYLTPRRADGHLQFTIDLPGGGHSIYIEKPR